jgi:hypothetical protein
LFCRATLKSVNLFSPAEILISDESSLNWSEPESWNLKIRSSLPFREEPTPSNYLNNAKANVIKTRYPRDFATNKEVAIYTSSLGISN